MMRKSPFTAATLVAVIAFVSSPLFVAGAAAQVVVEESEPIRGLGQQRTNSPSQSNSASGNANTQAEFFYQMQLLQQEVQNLRGMVEQLTYEVQQLKQQRMDDYLDLDRRISELSAGGAPVAGADTAGPTNVTPAEPGICPPVTKRSKPIGVRWIYCCNKKTTMAPLRL